MKKTTIATIKAFIRREINNNNLYIKVKSDFDGRVDCVMPVEEDLTKADKETYTEKDKNTLGLKGIWFVGRGSDYHTPYKENGFIGYEISNCCGSFVVAMKLLL